MRSQHNTDQQESAMYSMAGKQGVSKSRSSFAYVVPKHDAILIAGTYVCCTVSVLGCLLSPLQLSR